MRIILEKKQGNFFEIDKKNWKHIQVLRKKIGGKILVNYQGFFYETEILNQFKLKIIQKLPVENERKTKIGLALGLIKFSRINILIDMLVQLGVSEFYPLITEFVQKKNLEKFIKKQKQIQEIVENATNQSFRNKKIIIHKPKKICELDLDSYENKFFACLEKEQKNNFYKKNFFPGNSIFFVGPEGGFSESENKYFYKKNIIPVDLGNRILRSETAAIACVSKVKID